MQMRCDSMREMVCPSWKCHIILMKYLHLSHLWARGAAKHIAKHKLQIFFFSRGDPRPASGTFKSPRTEEKWEIPWSLFLDSVEQIQMKMRCINLLSQKFHYVGTQNSFYCYIFSNRTIDMHEFDCNNKIPALATIMNWVMFSLNIAE